MTATDANRSEVEPERLSKVLTELVCPGHREADIAGALASHPRAVNVEHFWAAVTHLAGLSPGGRANATRIAEELVTASIDREEALHACPNCAALWGFGRLHGIFSSAPVGSLVGSVAQANGLSEPLAAYALAAQQGSSLGRLAWGRVRAGGVATKQSEANALHSPNAGWAELPDEPQPGNSRDLEGCLEALQTAMAVSSAAVPHEHTLVPQPVDLDYVTRTRHEDHQNYALAAQLAADGHADGLAAKAEMLFYGKEKVVPQMPTLSAASESAGFQIPIAPLALLLAAFAGPFLIRAGIRFIRSCSRRLTGGNCVAAMGSRNLTAGSPSGARMQVITVFLLRIGLLLLAVVSWWAAIGSGVSLGPLLKNEDAALDLFAEAATAGHWGAAYALAMLKLDGENRSEATPWLEQVVEQGDGSARAMAQHFQHRFGLGVMKDAVRAGEYLQEAAELGEINAALLLAEAYAHDPEKLTSEAAEEVEPPGGRNLSQGLRYYRRAAEAGRLTCRYNIGVILVKHSGPAQEMPINTCREAYAEFIAVGTDLDPTIRLLFALAVRQWEHGDTDAALALFMLLSEAGSEKAHRNAAQLWEEKVGQSRYNAQSDDWAPTAYNTSVSEGDVLVPNNENNEDAPSEDCAAESSDVGETLHLLHEARFCCPSGTCDDPGWLSNDGGLEPLECAARCRAEPKCSFMTFYAMTGYCQLSSDCSLSHPAGDHSAQTFAIVRPPPRCKEDPRTRNPQNFATPSKLWCWPSVRSLELSRRCSAVYQLRATDFRGEAGAARGSAIAAGAAAAEAAMIAAAKNLQLLELPAHAKAWSCRAAEQFGSEHGRLLCAALEAESWQDHPRNLTAAAVELQNVARNGSISASITAYSALAMSSLRFVNSVVVKCRLQKSGQVFCPDLESSASSWGVNVAMLASLEKLLTVCVAIIILSFMCVGLLIVRRLRRLLKAC